MPSRRASCGLLLSLCFSMHAAAFVQSTPAVGGTGGNSYRAECRSDEILVGLHVAYGLWTDQVGGICATARDVLTGTWEGTRTIGGAGYPHLGTTKKELTCPAGYGVKSFTASSGSFINSITLTCHKLGQSWRTTSTSTRLARLGASGGSPQPAYGCSGGMHAVGIHGKAGEFVDSFGLLCGSVPPSTPTLQAPTGGLAVASRRPTFYWTGANRDLGTNLVCLNATQTSDCLATGTVRGEVDYTVSNWTPAEDLPFGRGTRVYWTVRICNDNDCRTRTSYFTAN